MEANEAQYVEAEFTMDCHQRTVSEGAYDAAVGLNAVHPTRGNAKMAQKMHRARRVFLNDDATPEELEDAIYVTEEVWEYIENHECVVIEDGWLQIFATPEEAYGALRGMGPIDDDIDSNEENH